MRARREAQRNLMSGDASNGGAGDASRFADASKCSLRERIRGMMSMTARPVSALGKGCARESQMGSVGRESRIRARLAPGGNAPPDRIIRGQVSGRINPSSARRVETRVHRCGHVRASALRASIDVLPAHFIVFWLRRRLASERPAGRPATTMLPAARLARVFA